MLMMLAMGTMAIDHVGLIFFNDIEFLRVIGRIAFPLYAFGIVMGYMHTRDLKKYFYRLIALAIISQVPYILLFQVPQLNVIFLFMIALFALYFVDHYKKSISIPLVLIGALIVQPFVEYGLYGLALVFIYRYLEGKKIFFAHSILSILYLLAYGSSGVIQLFALFGTLIIINKESLFKSPVRVNKLFYRSFYPAHLTLILLISLIIKSVA